MNKLTLLLLAGLLGGCAMGINHNVVTIDGKQYIAETPTRNILMLGQWSEKTTYKEISLTNDEEVGGAANLSELNGEINHDVKAALQAIYNECNAGRRDSFSVKKCIERKIKSL